MALRLFLLWHQVKLSTICLRAQIYQHKNIALISINGLMQAPQLLAVAVKLALTILPIFITISRATDMRSPS